MWPPALQQQLYFGYRVGKYNQSISKGRVAPFAGNSVASQRFQPAHRPSGWCGPTLFNIYMTFKNFNQPIDGATWPASLHTLYLGQVSEHSIIGVA